MNFVENSVKDAAQNKTAWNPAVGDYRGYFCDSDFYVRHKKELDVLLPRYGFVPMSVVKKKDGKGYITPVFFIKY